MRTAVLFGRFCSSRGGIPQLLSRFTLPVRWRFSRPPSCRQRLGRRSQSRKHMPRTLLLSSLTPGAFLKLAEEGEGNEKTGEMQMLEASRQEIQKSVTQDARGLSRLQQSIFVFWYYYIYDPVATGLRFAHLVVVFLPVILTVPVVWFGKRLKTRKDVRSGTLWWYNFLVRSMERAGPAFIKVGHHPCSATRSPDNLQRAY